MHHERDPLPRRLMWPDLVVEREEVRDLLGQGRGLLDLVLARVLTPLRAGRPNADILPTRRDVTIAYCRT